MASGRERRHLKSRRSRRHHYVDEERLREREEDRFEGKWSRGNKLEKGRRIKSVEDLLYLSLDDDEGYDDEQFF
jgi:hypothetical protein